MKKILQQTAAELTTLQTAYDEECKFFTLAYGNAIDKPQSTDLSTMREQVETLEKELAELVCHALSEHRQDHVRRWIGDTADYMLVDDAFAAFK